MKPFSGPRRFVFIPFFAAAFLFLISGVVMLLWNSILPAVFGFKEITYWQAMGLLVLSKILFGFGFKGGRPGWGRHIYWQKKMREQFANMTPEERSTFKDELRRRAMEMHYNHDSCRPPFFTKSTGASQPAENKDQSTSTKE